MAILSGPVPAPRAPSVAIRNSSQLGPATNATQIAKTVKDEIAGATGIGASGAFFPLTRF
jgi:hypothetical protein